MEQFFQWLENSLAFQDLVVIVAFVLIAVIAHYLFKNYVLRGLHFLVRQTRVSWDQTLFEQGAFDNIPHLVPALILYQGATLLNYFADGAQRLIGVWLVFILLRFLDRLLSAFLVVYNSFPIALRRPLKGYVQIVKLLLYISGGIVSVSILLNQSPWFFLSGLGALTAVLMLVFRDTILSFIASIQLMGNDLIRVGDWIEMPEFRADGDVEELALHTVKVRNWDKTITTIPTYKLIEGSFKNWRGMTDAGGRRIMRSILIDQSSIMVCNQEMIDKFSQIELIKDYVKNKCEELARHNQEHGFADNSRVNGRRMTNIGTFRAYLNAYLAKHSELRQDMTMLVRQLQPTTEGLPIQIYVFTKDVAWANYEAVQADIFDHILSIIPEFGLRVFQKPSGHDLNRVLPQNSRHRVELADEGEILAEANKQ